jgi:hypothetical protein
VVVIEVFLNDSGQSYHEAEKRFWAANLWALDHCESYTGHNITDVSDVSRQWDYLARYTFRDEQDAVLFRLRWQR